jgi:hypothetical protein
LRIGAAAEAAVESEGGPACVIAVADLAGDDLVVAGRWQRREGVRRVTGGPGVTVGSGVAYVAVALQTASVLMECPVEKVLNRNVRGICGGLGGLYFGRETLSVKVGAVVRPVALVAWERTASGAVLIEAFVGVTRALDVPAAHGGGTPVSLAEAWGRTPGVEEIAERIARGHAQRYQGLMVEEGVEPPAFAERPALPEDPFGARELTWSAPVAVPIGSVEAGVRFLASGESARIVEAGIAGDFFGDRDAPAALAAALHGLSPEREGIARAIDGTLGPAARPRRVIEGVPRLTAFLDAILDACERARGS